MDLRANTVVWGCGLSSSYTQLGKNAISSSMLGWNLNKNLAKLSKSVCCRVGLAQRAVTRIEDGKPLKSDTEIQGGTDGAKENGSTGFQFHRDLNALPKPLTASSFSDKDGDNAKVKVAYQGVPGSYSEDAALKAYPMCETVPCDEFEAAFKAVELWLVDRAVLPIENTLGGSIHRNYDLLLRHRLHIVAEVQLPINHCLLGLPGVRKEELKRVLSHPQALEQCNEKLSDMGLMKISTQDTAGAAKIMATERKRDTGAIASARAATIYGLDILKEKMQDENENITRYIVLAREPQIPGIGKSYKTSIVFSLEEGPGVLFKALAVFYLRDIVLKKIESRPQRKRPLRVVDDQNRGTARYFDYLFYIDFEASMAEPRAQFALGHLQEFSRFLRVLGCYPVYKVQ